METGNCEGPKVSCDPGRVQGRVMERGVDAYGLHLELDIPVSGIEGDRVVLTFLPSGLLDNDPELEDI